MPRYIDADKAKELFTTDHPIGIAMRKIFDELPTADVVPKSEVAMEIFEEIEKVACVYKLDGDFYIDNGLYAELEKKYTEGE